MVTLSLSIDDARFAALAKKAAQEGKPVEELAAAVVDEFIDEFEYLAAVDAGAAQLDAGEVVDGDVVFAKLDALLATLQK
jgi:predicted transcriptional regulator